MKLLKELNSLVENNQDIWEIELSFGADGNYEAPDEDIDYDAANEGYKFQCQVELSQRVGPSGGFPEYVFWGPKENMTKLISSYLGGDKEELEYYLQDLFKKSDRQWTAPSKPIMPEGMRLRKAAFLKGLVDNDDTEYKYEYAVGDTVTFYPDSESVHTAKITALKHGKYEIKFRGWNNEKEDFEEITKLFSADQIYKKR